MAVIEVLRVPHVPVELRVGHALQHNTRADRKGIAWTGVGGRLPQELSRNNMLHHVHEALRVVPASLSRIATVRGAGTYPRS